MWDGQGVNFALYSEAATKVELCLFDDKTASVERERIALPEVTGHVWHAYLPEIKPGQLLSLHLQLPDVQDGADIIAFQLEDYMLSYTIARTSNA